MSSATATGTGCAKAPDPIETTLLGKINVAPPVVLTLLPSKAPAPIVVFISSVTGLTVSAVNVIVAILVQPLNAFAPISVTEFGMVIVVNPAPAQFSKALTPIFCKAGVAPTNVTDPVGSPISVSLNALSPISVTVTGIAIAVIFLPSKALSSIISSLEAPVNVTVVRASSAPLKANSPIIVNHPVPRNSYQPKTWDTISKFLNQGSLIP